MAGISGGLPDYLTPGLSIIFVGINPGLHSSKVGHHFAGPSNRFWKLLFDAGLVPHQMTYHDDGQLLRYGYGLTNLIAKPTSGVQDLTKADFLQGRDVLREKIERYQPAIVAILGISVARILVPENRSKGSAKQTTRTPVQTGFQPLTFAGSRMFVLPNPSGRNAHYSYQTMKEIFRELNDASHGVPKLGM